MNFSTDHSRTAALIVGAALLVVIMVAAGFVSSAIDQSARLVRHTLEIQNVTFHTLSILQDAETGQRGFLLTGDATYLEPYERAVSAMAKNAGKLANLIADNPKQQQSLSELTALSQNKLTELNRTIELKREGKSDEALAIVFNGSGKALMDRARSVIANIIAEEDRLLTSRESDNERDQRRLFILLSSAALAILGLGGYAAPWRTKLFTEDTLR
jgi:CHASE3 domain sensor protein